MSDSEKVDATGAGLVVLVDNLTTGEALPGTDALVSVGKTRAGLPSNLMGDVTKVDVPVTGEESPWLPCNLGRADTNFVTFDTKEELRDWAPTNRTCVALGTVVSTGNATGGVRTPTGDLRAGTLGILGRGEMGNAANLGVAETGLGPVGGTAAGMVTVPVLGTWPEMTSTWLPGPKPCGGTTNRALLSRICVPAARWVLVFMTILC